MKKALLSLLAVVALMLSIPALADDGRIIIPFEQLPEASKALLKQLFPDKTPIVDKVERDDSKVIYQTDEKVEFNRDSVIVDIDFDD